MNNDVAYEKNGMGMSVMKNGRVGVKMWDGGNTVYIYAGEHRIVVTVQADRVTSISLDPQIDGEYEVEVTQLPSEAYVTFRSGVEADDE